MLSPRWKKIVLVLALVIVAFWGYVEIINVNSENMTVRQKILKAVYPVFTWLAKAGEKNNDELSNNSVKPRVSFYSLKGVLNDGRVLEFNSLKGKKILLVNTASDCGYTPQYTELQKLYEQYHENVVVIGYPANDFKEQEKGSDEEIAKFCRQNFGVTFPLMKKTVVIKTSEQNAMFKWLTDSSQNGWNNKPPSWNFTKYLVNENGMLVNYFGSSISPEDKDVLAAIKK